jgi:hypothetical protein
MEGITSSGDGVHILLKQTPPSRESRFSARPLRNRDVYKTAERLKELTRVADKCSDDPNGSISHRKSEWNAGLLVSAVLRVVWRPIRSNSFAPHAGARRASWHSQQWHFRYGRNKMWPIFPSKSQRRGVHGFEKRPENVANGVSGVYYFPRGHPAIQTAQRDLL